MSHQSRLGVVCVVFALTLVPTTGATVCVVSDNGTGTADMPPAAGTPTCTVGYVSPTDLHEIINGLDPGDTIEIGPEHTRFLITNVLPGGPLGGQQEIFDSDLQLQLQGTGNLAGFVRDITVPLTCTTATAPRTPGADVQTFDTEMVQLVGSLPLGDPDFLDLTIRAGSFFGLPSPGETTLTRLGPPGSDFNVDSFFDITYQIDFVGAPGSAIAGLSGTTQGTVRMQIGGQVAATPASDWTGLWIAIIALAMLVPLVVYMRRQRTA